MNNEIYFKDLFKSIPDYRKVVILRFQIKSNFALLSEFGFLKDDINRLCLEFKKILNEQCEDYLEYFKNEEESILQKILNV